MRIGPLAFPGWTALLAAALCAIGIALGNWQTGRAAQKRWVAERLSGYDAAPALPLGVQPVAAGEYAWRKVEARGEYVPGGTVFLANRSHRGRPGYYVVTPLRIDGGARAVLVIRGWLAAGSAPPAADVPRGPRTVRGLALPQIPRLFDPGGAVPGAQVRQNIDIAGYELESQVPLQPVAIEQRGIEDAGLVQDWPAHDALLDKHRMYAGQWYALAALSVGIFLILSFRHGRNRTTT